MSPSAASAKKGKAKPHTRSSPISPDRQQLADFCARVRYMIDRYDEGNVTAAARRLDVPQRTLAKVYAGETEEPRLSLVQTMIRKYPQEDPMWILLGQESASSDRFADATRVQAVHLLRRLVNDLTATPDTRPEPARPSRTAKAVGH